MTKSDIAASIGAGAVIIMLLLIFLVICFMAWAADFRPRHVAAAVLLVAMVIGGGGWIMNKLTTDGVASPRSIGEQMSRR